MKLCISLLATLSLCSNVLFADYYERDKPQSSQLPHITTKISENSYITFSNIDDIIKPLSITQNRDIYNYIKKMSTFGYNDYWGNRLSALTYGPSQQMTALTYLNSYYIYEKNKYNNYIDHYCTLDSTTHWYNYLFNKPASLIYKSRYQNSKDNLDNLSKIRDAIISY